MFSTKGTVNLSGSLVLKIPSPFNIFDKKPIIDFSQPLFDNDVFTIWDVNFVNPTPETISLDDFEGLWKNADNNGWAVRLNHFDGSLKADAIFIETGEETDGYGFAVPYVLSLPDSKEIPISIYDYEMLAGQDYKSLPPIKILLYEDKQRLIIHHFGNNMNPSKYSIKDSEEAMTYNHYAFTDEFVRMDEDEIGFSVNNSNVEKQQLETLTADEVFQVISENLPEIINNGLEWIPDQSSGKSVFQFIGIENDQTVLKMIVKQLDGNKMVVDLYSGGTLLISVIV